MGAGLLPHSPHEGQACAGAVPGDAPVVDVGLLGFSKLFLNCMDSHRIEWVKYSKAVGGSEPFPSTWLKGVILCLCSHSINKYTRLCLRQTAGVRCVTVFRTDLALFLQKGVSTA